MASITILPRSRWTTWAPGSWVAICSARCAVPGMMSPGRAGGVTIRRTIRRCLSSRIMRARRSMEGGTTFYFVTDGIESALKKAKEAAKGKDVRIGGGVATIRQYLTAGLIDEIHLALSPVFLGEGEHLFMGLNLHAFGFTSIKTVASERVTHVLLKKR